jgi:hypothetical protein
MNTQSQSTTPSATVTPRCLVSKINPDRSIEPQDLQRAQQAFALSGDDSIAVLKNWCGNASIMAQCGRIGAATTHNHVDTGSQVMMVSMGIPQLQIVGETAEFESLMNELLKCKHIGMALGEYAPGRWVAGLLLIGQTRPVMLCLDALSPMTRRLVQRWMTTEEVSVLFGDAARGCRSHTYWLNAAQTPAKILALRVPEDYTADALSTWEGMQWLAAQRGDPNTLYLCVFDEADVTQAMARH